MPTESRSSAVTDTPKASGATPAAAPERKDGAKDGEKPGGTPAERALAEAAERRAARERMAQGEKTQPTEIGGRGGLDPTRYDDWEINGLAADF